MIIPQTDSKINPFDLLNTCGISAFTLLRPRDKRPIDDGWTDSPHSAAAARAHLASGGNVGIAMGTPNGGLVGVDTDHGIDPEAVRKHFDLPHNALSCTRPDAPQRRKFFVRVTDELPSSTKWNVYPPAPKQPGDIDLLALTSTGKQKQAFIIGQHPDGAMMELHGDVVPELSRADFDARWATLDALRPADAVAAWAEKDARAANIAATLRAQPAPQAAQRPQATRQPTGGHTSPIDAAKAAWSSAYAVFEHFGYADNPRPGSGDWIELGTGIGLHVRNPNGDNPHGWHAHAGGERGGLLDAWAYCRTGQLPQRSDAVAIARDMLQAAGLESSLTQPSTGTRGTNQPSASDILQAAGLERRTTARSTPILTTGKPSAGELVEQLHNTRAHVDRAGGVNAIGPGETCGALGVLAIMERAGKAEAAISVSDLRREMGCWNEKALKTRRMLERWLIEPVDTPDHDGAIHGTIYRLRPEVATICTKIEHADASASPPLLMKTVRLLCISMFSMNSVSTRAFSTAWPRPISALRWRRCAAPTSPLSMRSVRLCSWRCCAASPTAPVLARN